LDLKPLEGSSRELLLGSSVIESIGHIHVREILQDRTLHSQLVEVGVEEGDDPFRKRGRTVEVHGEVTGGGLQLEGGEALLDMDGIEGGTRVKTCMSNNNAHDAKEWRQSTIGD
jgi:hypothetical protein